MSSPTGPPEEPPTRPMSGPPAGSSRLPPASSSELPAARQPGARVRAATARRRDFSRLRALIIFLLLIGGGALAVWLILRADDRQHPIATPSPSPCTSSRPVAAALRVRVLNGTNRPGLAASVAAQLRARGHVVTGIGNSAEAVPGPADLRYGPSGAAAARRLLALVPGAARHQDRRAGADVELVLGNRFTRLAPAARTPSPSASGCPGGGTPKPSPKRS